MRLDIWKASTLVLAGALSLSVGSNFVSAEPQPHMKAALVGLQTVKNQLEKATHDKGGHRVKALALVNQAIDEVKAGIEFDNKHQQPKAGEPKPPKAPPQPEPAKPNQGQLPGKN